MGGKKRRRRAVPVEVDGITVRVDREYLLSWEGVRQAARMQAEGASDAERLLAMVGYYESAIANADEVSAAMPGASAEAVLSVMSRAVAEAAPKN